MDTPHFTTLDALALALTNGGSEISDFLSSPSGEGNLTMEQALGAHCSARATQGALKLLTKIGGRATASKEISDFLLSPSGEGKLTMEQTLGAHCSATCAQGALKLLKKYAK
jgi:hypothetical protein